MRDSNSLHSSWITSTERSSVFEREFDFDAQILTTKIYQTRIRSLIKRVARRRRGHAITPLPYSRSQMASTFDDDPQRSPTPIGGFPADPVSASPLVMPQRPSIAINAPSTEICTSISPITPCVANDLSQACLWPQSSHKPTSFKSINSVLAAIRSNRDHDVAIAIDIYEALADSDPKYSYVLEATVKRKGLEVECLPMNSTAASFRPVWGKVIGYLQLNDLLVNASACPCTECTRLFVVDKLPYPGIDMILGTALFSIATGGKNRGFFGWKSIRWFFPRERVQLFPSPNLDYFYS